MTNVLASHGFLGPCLGSRQAPERRHDVPAKKQLLRALEMRPQTKRALTCGLPPRCLCDGCLVVLILYDSKAAKQDILNV